MVIRSNAPPANILNIPKMPFALRAKISDKICGSIPGNGIKVPKRKTIRAKTVNQSLFFSSVALLKADTSIFAAIFSANDTISTSLSVLK